MKKVKMLVAALFATGILFVSLPTKAGCNFGQIDVDVNTPYCVDGSSKACCKEGAVMQ